MVGTSRKKHFCVPTIFCEYHPKGRDTKNMDMMERLYFKPFVIMIYSRIIKIKFGAGTG
jgi:hypothetical protein